MSGIAGQQAGRRRRGCRLQVAAPEFAERSGCRLCAGLRRVRVPGPRRLDLAASPGHAASGAEPADHAKLLLFAGPMPATLTSTMNRPPRSPRVDHLSWGSIQVSDPDASYKDAKLFPGGSRAWDWKETGTQHVPGIQPADVEELLDRGARVVVLGQGMFQRLRVQDATLRRLEEAGVEAHVAETREAVRVYKELREKGEAVGGLFHSTC